MNQPLDDKSFEKLLKESALERLYAMHDFYVMAGQHDRVLKVDEAIKAHPTSKVVESISEGLDEHYAAQAIDAAKRAAMNLEEAKLYADDISDAQLRKETEDMIDRLIEGV